MKSSVNEVTGRHTILWEPAERDAGPDPFADLVHRYVMEHRIADAIVFALSEAHAAACARRPGFVRARADREYSRTWPAKAGPADRAGVRPVTTDDSNMICGIIHDAMGLPFGTLDTPAAIRKNCFQGDRFNAILTVDGGDAAYGNAIHAGEGAGSIGWLAVRPAFQRRGLGRRLFRILLEELDRHPRDTIWLDVEEQNFPAIRLYESFGFRESGGPYVQVEYRRIN